MVGLSLGLPHETLDIKALQSPVKPQFSLEPIHESEFIIIMMGWAVA